MMLKFLIKIEQLYFIVVCLLVNLFFVFRMGTNAFIIDYSEFNDKRYNHLKTFKIN